MYLLARYAAKAEAMAIAILLLIDNIYCDTLTDLTLTIHRFSFAGARYYPMIIFIIVLLSYSSQWLEITYHLRITTVLQMWW